MSHSPRIPLIPTAEFTDQQAQLGGGRGSPRGELNIVRALVNHPALYRSWIPFAEQLVYGSTLPAREREILIIRTGELCGERYEAIHHVHIGRTAGLSDEEMRSAATDGVLLSEFEQALVRASNELIADHCISDTTWATLAGRYTREQLMEVVFVVANYSLMAMVTNSFGIIPEADVGAAWKPF
jgi:4-carboxymuconolactone decarboxylase